MGVGFDVWLSYLSVVVLLSLLLCRALSASHIVPSKNTTYKVHSHGPVAHTAQSAQSHPLGWISCSVSHSQYSLV